MKESVLNMLKPCKECGELTYNRDGFCDTCPSETEEKSDGKDTADTQSE